MSILSSLKDWNTLSVCARLLLAFLSGTLLGLRPEFKRRPAGLRTHILVCLGATTATMTGFYVYYNFSMQIDPLRIAAQIISGISFLGVGTIIIIGRSQVKGLTTAAGLWTCAAVGIALGAGFFLGGILCMILALITIIAVETFEKQKLKKFRHIDIYLEITDIHKVNHVVSILREPQYCISNMQIKRARSEITNNLGVEATLKVDKNTDRQKLLSQIAEIDEIAFAIESE